MSIIDNNLVINKKKSCRSGFSLVEIIAVTVISSMVMISTLMVFNHIRKATAAVNARLDKEDIADEILHRIAEDLDRLAVPGFDTRVTLQNRMVSGFNKCRLTIENKFYDKDNKPQTFEKVVWHSQYDVMEERLTLYRYHGGLSLEDKILDVDLEKEQSEGIELYVPVTDEITLFEIVVPKKDADPLTQWSNETLPTAVVVNISFAMPVENIDGTLEILEEDIITRNIAIDRTRKPKFSFKKKDFTKPEDDEEKDPNDVDTEIDETDKTGSNSETDKDTNDNADKEKKPGSASTSNK